MKILTTFLIAAVLTPGWSDAEKPTTIKQSTTSRMAITIDDLPVAQPSWHTPEQMEQITHDLLTVLRRHGITAIGFVNEGKLMVGGGVDPARLGILEQWLEAGHELGNHGFAHLDLHRVSSEDWMADVVKGEGATKALVEAKGNRYRWFRHPFLHTGMSVEIQLETAEFLAERGYTITPVTMDNSEWVYGRAYADAYNTGDRELMRRIGEDYVRYMVSVVEFWEGQTAAIIGHPIPHILLIHAYALNADWLDALLTALEDRGYVWISAEAAIGDPVYDRPIAGWIGRGGISWLHRWAITEDLDRSIFAGEPEVPPWVETPSP